MSAEEAGSVGMDVDVDVNKWARVCISKYDEGGGEEGEDNNEQRIDLATVMGSGRFMICTVLSIVRTSYERYL